jgi:hypothetical protein
VFLGGAICFAFALALLAARPQLRQAD